MPEIVWVYLGCFAGGLIVGYGLWPMRLDLRAAMSMRTPRFLARWSAHAGGYFWLPCPLCSRHFGGQEWRSVNDHMVDIPTGQGWSGTAICPSCVAAGRGCQAWAKNQPPLACATCRPSLIEIEVKG